MEGDKKIKGMLQNSESVVRNKQPVSGTISFKLHLKYLGTKWCKSFLLLTLLSFEPLFLAIYDNYADKNKFCFMSIGRVKEFIILKCDQDLDCIMNLKLGETRQIYKNFKSRNEKNKP